MKIPLIQLHATRNREDNIARSIRALEEAVCQGLSQPLYETN